MAKTLPNSGMVIPEIGDGPADVTKLTDALTTLDGVIGTLKTNISLLQTLTDLIGTKILFKRSGNGNPTNFFSLPNSLCILQGGYSNDSSLYLFAVGIRVGSEKPVFSIVASNGLVIMGTNSEGTIDVRASATNSTSGVWLFGVSVGQG